LHYIYKEHIQVFKNNNGNSGYSNEILSAVHAYISETDTTKVLKIETEKKKRSKHNREIPYT
jgi:hypothetical protein